MSTELPEKLPTHHKVEEELLPFIKSHLTRAESGLYIHLSEEDYEQIGEKILIGEAYQEDKGIIDPREFGKMIVVNILAYLNDKARRQPS